MAHRDLLLVAPQSMQSSVQDYLGHDRSPVSVVRIAKEPLILN
jgi:hypothetical protein